MKQHKSITTLQGEDIVFLATDINLPGAVDWVMMQSCFGAYFMLVLEKQDKQEQGGASYQMFYAIVQLIGTKKEAENFVYRWVANSGYGILMMLISMFNMQTRALQPPAPAMLGGDSAKHT